MTSQRRSTTPRFRLDIARLRMVVVVVLVMATPSQAPLAAQSSPLDTTAPSVSITSPAAGERVARTITIAAAAADAVGVTSVAFRVDGTIVGSDEKPPYTARWNTRGVADGSHTLRAEARDAAGNVGTSTPVVVIVGTATDTTPPTVNITSPAGGAQVTGTVDVTAAASDAVGVTSVTFLVDAAAIATDSSSPYSVSWNTSVVAAGSHTLRAEARDAAGNVGMSAAVAVTTVAANRPPSVTLTAPAAGSSHQAPATITLAANATDSDGSVSRVDFYQGSAKIGSDTTSPFSVAWTVSTAGTYVLSATAVDNAGTTTVSGSVTVTVTSASRPTKAVFQPSADNSSVLRYVLDVFLQGSNPATSAPVATQDLGKPSVVNGEITADIASTTASLPPATYIATVAAVTSSSSARSAASPSFVIASTSSVTLLSARSASEAPRAADPHGVLWVTNSSTAIVTAFDATTGDVLATIPVGLKPTGIAAPMGVGKVYVADEGSDTVSVISKATMTLSLTIPLPPPFGRQPHDISGSPDGRFIYVAELGANVVDVIDTATDQISARFSTGWPGSRTHAVVPDPSGAVVYAVNQGAAAPGTLVALNAETGHWLWQLPIEGDPSDFSITSDGRTGVVTRHADSAVDVIDLERHAVIKTIELAPGHHAGILQLTLNGRLVLVTLSTTPAHMGIVDLAAMTALPPVSLAGSATGSALPARQLSYVSVSASSEFPPGVVAVDAGSRSVVRRFRFPGGGSPHAVVFDPD